MTDRELLELAAKAAGFEIDKSPDNGGGAKNDGFDVMGNAVLDWHNGRTWNPLSDDGDALRLAVKLQLTICNEHITSGTAYCIDPSDKDKEFPNILSGTNEGEVIEADYAATRLAIVRAAAEIGKSLMEKEDGMPALQI